jgi:mono/diheme cytochrome c family protein
MRRFWIASLLCVPFFISVDASAQGDAAAGRDLWQDRGLTRCGDCHGSNGEGGFGPDLAGRALTLDQFMRAVRRPWGVMPAYPPLLYSDTEIANLHAFLTSLPQASEPGPWRTALPSNATRPQELLIAGVGCAQCHGDGLPGPRTDAGSVGADFDWWKDLVYDHATTMPGLRTELGENPGAVRMGNYSRARLPESVLEEIFLYLRDDLGYRVAIGSSLRPGTVAGSYTLVVENAGRAGRGLTAENVVVTLNLEPGTTISNAPGSAFQGVAGGTEAVWRVPRLGPEEEETFTFTVGGAGQISGGTVAWRRQGTNAPDSAPVAIAR